MDLHSLFGGLRATQGIPISLPHPGVPLKCESLAGGGGQPSRAVADDIYSTSGSLAHDSLDLGMMDRDERAAAIDPHILQAHKLALDASSPAEIRAAIEVAQGRPCPQAHVRLAEESATLAEALLHYKQAAVEAEQLIELFAPSIPIGALVEATGLASRPELNGRQGVVTRFFVAKGRYSVRIGGEDMLLKRESLDVLAAGNLSMSAAKRQATCSPDSSLWDCLLARPWFRAVLGVANTQRKLGCLEEALTAYMQLEAVDGKHFVTNSSGFVQWRNYIASCLLLLGRPREARGYLLRTSRAVIEYTFIYASSALFFAMSLALSEYLIALEVGEMRDPPGPVPLEEADGHVTHLAEHPELIWWRLSTGGPDGLCTFAATYEYLFDDNRQLPDLTSIPNTIGNTDGHGQAVAYLSGGILELWRSTRGAINMVRRQHNYFQVRALMIGDEVEKNVDTLQRYLTDPAGLPGVERAVDILVMEASWYEPRAERERVLSLLLAAVGNSYPPADQQRPERDTVLCQSMYYDNQPQTVRQLIDAGALCWWSVPPGWENDPSRIRRPLAMAVEQGSWKPLAIALALKPELRSSAILSQLADGIYSTTCALCVAGAIDGCARCRNQAPGDAPDYAHSPTASFEMVVDVLIHYGLRTAPEPPAGAVRVAAQTAHHPRAARAIFASKLVERFRGRIANALGRDAVKPKRCVGCDGAPRSACRKCDRCLQAWYCSNECQARHWQLIHKSVCGPPAAERMRRRIQSALDEAGVVEAGVVEAAVGGVVELD
mgnify:FL=1